MIQDRISKLFKKVQNISSEQIEKIERENDEIRKTEKYKFYMEKCSIGELKSIIIYNTPYVTDPSYNLSCEEQEKIKTLMKTVNIALEDKMQQMREEYGPNAKKR